MYYGQKVSLAEIKGLMSVLYVDIILEYLRSLFDMEAWIFMVTLGSGYLSERWKNAMKQKDDSTEKSNDGHTVVSSSPCLVSSMRRKICRQKEGRLNRNGGEGNTSWYQSVMPIADFFSSEQYNMQHRFTKNVKMHEVANAIDGEHFYESCAFDGCDVLSFSDDSRSPFSRTVKDITIQQKRDRKCGNFCKRSNKNLRNRGFSLRRKHFESQKTIRSSGNRLSDQVGKSSMEHGKTVSMRLSEKGGFSHGLPSLPRRSSLKKPLGKMEKIKDCQGESDPHDERRFHKQGASESLIKSLIFSFGVGVGMMFNIMSNMRKVNDLVRIIEEAEWLLEGLQCNLDRRSNSYGTDLFGSLSERNPCVNSTIAKLRSTIALLNRVKKQLCHGKEQPNLAMCHPNKMSKLEAELEAELERMEIDLDTRCIPSCPVSEFHLTAEHLMEGEVCVSNPPHGELLDTKGKDCSYCSNEDTCFLDSGVSPVKLASCLHEVIEARQKKKIRKLKNELKLMGRKLQAKEHELHLWKKGMIGLPGEALTAHNESRDELSQNESYKATSPSIVTPTKGGINVYRNDEDMAFSGKKLFKGMIGKGKTYENRESGWSDDGSGRSGWSDDDTHFLSMIEDSSSDAEDSEFTMETPTECKGVSSCSPQQNQVFGSTRHIELFDDVAIHEFGMAPCFVKSSMGSSTTKDVCECFDQSEKKTVNDCCLKPFNFKWSFSPEEMIVDTSRDMKVENNRLFRSAFDWSMSQESSYPSDLDEQLGQLLIDRIVEKSRRGSSIIDVAHSMLASFDQGESLSSTPTG